MRTLDSFAADLIAIDGSKNPLIEMSTRLFGLRFKGSGFYFPFELEDQMTTSSSNLRTPPPNHGLREGPTDEFPLFHQNVSDEGGNILPYSEDGGESPFQVPNFDHQDEIMRQLEDLDEKDEPSSFALSDVNDSISSRCPCETKARVSRRPDRCVSRFCILAMVDICEDLMRADKLPLWDLYMDGLIPYYCTREFLPDPAPDPANEDECCCVEWSDSDTDQYSLPDDSNIQTHVCMQLDFETRTDSDDVVTCAEDVEGKDLETSDTNEISSHYIDELQAGHDPNQCTNSVNELDSCSDVNFEDNPEGLVHLGDPVLDCIIKETQEGMNALRTHDTAFNLTIHSDRIVASKEVSMSADVLTPDCETQSRSILFRDEEEGRVGRAVDIQKEMTVANMETQKEVEIVDTAIQYKITPVSDEDIKTQIDMESEDCSHVFIQTTMETNELLYPETVKYNSVKSIKHTCSLNTQPNLSPCNENDQNERVQKDKVSLHQDYEELPITAKDKKSSEVQYDSKKSQSQKVVDEKRSSNHSIFPEHTDKKTTDTRRHSLGNGNLAKFWSKPSKTCVIRNRRCAIL
ncbi:unnamed protein product [Allacma fusca]|uniref:Uncharacterized protein n=1 Tax=Allacma fusca TaxID=39272 RepID=A0A8J2Q091_9HEXA|nr:unnamed protein product [Allacma fusca]